MKSLSPEQKFRMNCSVAALASAAAGAVAAVGYAIVLARGSGFVVWVAPGAALVGSLAGAASFIGGALAYRALRRFGRRAIPRAAAIMVAGATAGVVAFSALAVTKSVYIASTTVGVVLFAVAVSAVALRPLERSINGFE